MSNFNFKKFRCKKGTVRYTYRINSKFYLVNQIVSKILDIMVEDILNRNVQYFIGSKDLLFTYDDLYNRSLIWAHSNLKHHYQLVGKETKVFIFRKSRKGLPKTAYYYCSKENLNRLQEVNNTEYPETINIMKLQTKLEELYPDLTSDSIKMCLRFFITCIRASFKNKDDLRFSNYTNLKHIKSPVIEKRGYHSYFKILRELKKIYGKD